MYVEFRIKFDGIRKENTDWKSWPQIPLFSIGENCYMRGNGGSSMSNTAFLKEGGLLTVNTIKGMLCAQYEWVTHLGEMQKRQLSTTEFKT